MNYEHLKFCLFGIKIWFDLIKKDWKNENDIRIKILNMFVEC